MGFLDAFFSSNQDQTPKQPAGGLLGLDPTTMGLLSAASAGLMASGPSRTPVSTGQVFGSMLHNGLLGYQSALDSQGDREDKQTMRDYRKAQITEMARKTKNEEELDNFMKSRFLGTPGTMPAADMEASKQALSQGAAFGDIGPTVTNAQRMDAIRPPQLQGPNSPFPFSLNDVAMLKWRGRDLTDVYKLATDPIKLEAGSTYKDRATGAERYMPKISEGMTLGPDGQVSVAPGYLGALGGIKGTETNAVERTKANFDLLPLGYVGVDGRPIGGTRGGYINSLNQSPVSAPSRPGMPTQTPAGFPQVSPEVQRGRDSDAYRLIQAEYEAEKDPANRAALGRELTRMQGRTYGPGAGGAPVLQSEAEKQQQIGAITGRQSTQQDLNKNWITASYNPVLEAGRAANSMTASLDALKTFDLQTGWGAEAKAHAANVLTGLGIAPDNAKLFATNAQKFQSIAMDRLLTVLQAQKGPQTEGDSTRAQQTFAQLKNTPQANQFIADFARAKANMDARRAQYYQEALPLAHQAGDLNEIDRRWSKIQGSIWADPVLQPYLRGK